MPYPTLDEAGNPILPRHIAELKLIDFEDRLVTGDLTDDGVQYSDEVATGGANVDVIVLEKTVDPVIDGDILWVEFGLTAEIKAATSATADLKWLWQARNKDGTWVDLHPQITDVDIGTTYVSRTRQGFFKIVANFQEVPFEIRFLLQCNEENEGRARVKSSSYVRVVYKAT